mgnify:CR=1 FL=1
MKFLGNIIWLLFGGIITSVEYLISSLILMITIIGIPFGLQTLKLAILALWPFGSRVVDEGNSGGCLSLIMNIALRIWDSAFCYVSRSSASLSACNILRWQL